MRKGVLSVADWARSAALCLVLATFATSASAASIVGDLTFSGDWSASGSLGTATGLSFPGNDFDVDGANGDFSSIAQGDVGSIADFDFSLSGGDVSLLSIAGFTFILDSVNVEFQNDNVLLLAGSGLVSGNGFDPTLATFSFSANVAGPLRVYSGGISAVPVPAGVWLFASALAALGFRRK